MAVTMSSPLRAQENVVIVLDDSGSMNERMSSGVTRIEAAKNAISGVVLKFAPDTKLGLFLLNGAANHQHWAIPLGPLSATQSIQKIKALRADGGTPLGDRIREGTDALLKLREKQIYGVYRLLIVTDGEANDAKMLAAYLPDVLSRGIIVDAIGVDMKQNHSLATRVHSYRRADDDEGLTKAVQEVFAERIDSSNSGSKEEYQMLQDLDGETAREVLKILAKPNNEPIVGMKPPESWSKGVVETSHVATSGVGFAGAVLTAMFSCMIPVILFVFVLVMIVSKSKRR
jgi:uncharacterized protein YegL